MELLEHFEDKTVREEWYQQLSEASSEDLRKMLVVTAQSFNASVKLKETVIEELYNTFGSVIFGNFYQAMKYRLILPPRREEVTPKLPMRSLIEQQPIIDAMNEMEWRKRQDRNRKIFNGFYENGAKDAGRTQRIRAVLSELRTTLEKLERLLEE